MVLFFVTGAAFAGPIESACNRSDRDAANRALCNCIGQVADFTLLPADERRVATFFKDPDKAQKTKMSESRADDAFWERYKAFSETAQAYCAQ
jgi:hypothetical protein